MALFQSSTTGIFSGSGLSSLNGSRSTLVNNDSFSLTENSLLFGFQSLGVHSNDINAPGIYSIGTTASSLATRDNVGAVNFTGQGARIWITLDGRVAYDVKSVPTLAAKIDALPAGQTLIDTFFYGVKSSDGSIKQAKVTVTLRGSNDAATITAKSGGDYLVVEAGGVNNAFVGDPSAGGQLKISDKDTGEAKFQAPSSLSGEYGTFTFNANTGGWTYVLDNARAATQALSAGESETDKLKVKSWDGSDTFTIVVTVKGSNDAVTVTGAVVGVAIEDGAAVSLNALANAFDPDAPENDDDDKDLGNDDLETGEHGAGSAALIVVDVPVSLPPGVTYNPLTFSFTLDPSAKEYQDLASGETRTVTVTYGVTDGAITVPASVRWTVTGTNDVVTIVEADTAGSVKEDVTLSDTGIIHFTDVDLADVHAVSSAPSALNTTRLGTLVLVDVTEAAGAAGGSVEWTYTLNTAAAQFLAEGETITESYVLTVSDGKGGSATQTIVVTITGATDNTAPVVTAALADQTSPEDTLFMYAVPAGSFADPNSDALTYTASLANGGALPAWLSFNAGTQTFSGMPPSNFHGSIDVRVTASDGTESVSDVFVLEITPVNDAPVAVDGSSATDEDTVLNGTLPVAIDVDSESLTYASGTTEPTKGIVVINSNGAYVYTPNANATGSDTFSYTVSDGIVTVEKTMTITIAPINDAPVAVNGSAATDEDMVLNGTLPVATDVDSESLTYASGTTEPTKGTVVINSNGAYVYMPNANANGADSFSYTVSDGNTIVEKTISITITPVNDAPEAFDGLASTDEDTPLNGRFPTANDIDNNNESLTYAAGAIVPTMGTVSVNEDGTYLYLPDPDASGTDSFSYTVTDGDKTVEKTMLITVASVNDVPTIAASVVHAMLKDTADDDIFESVSGVLNTTDADLGDTATFSITGGVADVSLEGYTHSLDGDYGTLHLNSVTGAFLYVPNDVAIESLKSGNVKDDFMLAVTDHDGATAVTTFIAEITGANDTAVISGYTSGYSVIEAGGGNGGVSYTEGVLEVADRDAGDLGFQALASLQGTYGSFAFNAETGAWSYQLDNDNADTQSLGEGHGSADQLTVLSADGSISELINVNIRGSNDLAIIGGVSTGAVTEDVAVAFGHLTTAGALSVVDVDAGQASFVAQEAAAGAYGTFTLSAAGAWTYATDNSQAAIQALNNGQSLTDSFTAVSLDGSASQVVVVTINGASEPVVAMGERILLSQDTNGINLTQMLLANDSAMSGQPLKISSINTTGTSSQFVFSLDPATHQLAVNVGQNPESSGQVSPDTTFTYTVIDGLGGEATATATLAAVNVTPDNNSTNLTDSATYGSYQQSYIDSGNGGDTTIGGGSAADIFVGGSGSDTLDGASGNDTLIGGADNDDLLGSGGNDTYVFSASGNGSDDIAETSGVDAILINSDGTALSALNLLNTNADSPVANDLRVSFNDSRIDVLSHYHDGESDLGGVGRVESLMFVGGASFSSYVLTGAYGLAIDNLSPFTGTGNNDLIAGSLAGQTLDGGDGADVLFGNGGVDTLIGGDGNDLLVGGDEGDTLTGGAGDDTFLLTREQESQVGSAARDVITDFTDAGVAGGDVIDLGLFGGTLSFIATAAFATNAANQVRFSVLGSDTLIQISTDADEFAEAEILLQGTHMLTVSDFIL